MPILVRKINQAKWPKEHYDKILIDNLSADAITSCLRTSLNALSLWEVNDVTRLDEAALALVSSAERIDTIDVVFIENNDLQQFNFVIEDTLMEKLPVVDLRDKHKDISKLTYKTLGDVASVVITCLHNNRIKRFTRSKLKSILRIAIDSGRLKKEELNKTILDDLA